MGAVLILTLSAAGGIVKPYPEGHPVSKEDPCERQISPAVKGLAVRARGADQNQVRVAAPLDQDLLEKRAQLRRKGRLDAGERRPRENVFEDLLLSLIQRATEELDPDDRCARVGIR